MTLTQVLTSRDRAVAKLNEWPMMYVMGSLSHAHTHHFLAL
jgi:hypothetical protein